MGDGVCATSIAPPPPTHSSEKDLHYVQSCMLELVLMFLNDTYYDCCNTNDNVTELVKQVIFARQKTV